ncbi:hypothetical protein SBOR_2528 [Sclerotinia borealis F-4128]|uniref:Uncharacterized protein n=1 Tax=Sclerotinia borealis (strain F-4128) TaxID=1432307 RepID=W9CM32_SCLBF|nr:hypothetical protein SBOR_2528 [Sclerotinia borealis F-4128]
MTSFPNIWTHRKVAETASKPYEAAVAAKKKKEMDDEIERVKQEFEEKQRKKKEKETAKKDDKEKDVKDKKDGGKEDEKKTDEKIKSDTPTSSAQSSTPDQEPRVFSLKKAFYQQRLDRKKQAEIAKRSRERFQNPNLFPQVPKDLP